MRTPQKNILHNKKAIKIIIIYNKQRFIDCITKNPIHMKKIKLIKNLLAVFLILLTSNSFAQNESLLATWTGSVNDDWFNVSNWSDRMVPTYESVVTIPSNLRNYPIINSRANVKSIILDSGAVVTLNDTLEVSNSITNSQGTFNASNGTIKFNLVGSLTLAQNLFSQNTIKNLVVGEDCKLTLNSISLLNVTGSLTLLSKAEIYTNDNLVLKSTADGTARISAIPNGALFVGKATIERYIPARKAWRLLGVPVKSATAPTIHQSWQENASYQSLVGTGSNSFANIINPASGYGVFVIGAGGIANGFDPANTTNSSMKYYDNATNTFIGIPSSPGTHTSIADYPGYMVYIRGDRGIDLTQGTSSAITATTLRVKGEPITGNATVNVSSGNYTLMSNPYASAIDFGTLTKSNVKNKFYAWNPNGGGYYGLGSYVTVSYDSTTGNYDVSPNTNSISQYIPSGAAVFVQPLTPGVSGQIVVKESDKVNNNADASLWGRYPVAAQSMRVNLYAYDLSGMPSLLDGVLSTYNSRNSNLIDNNDAEKFYGSGESVSLSRYGKALSIERRKTISNTDTSYISLNRLRRQTYKMEITTANLNTNGLMAVLLDNYDQTINNRSINTNGTTNIDFVVDANPASYAPDRFKIVFRSNPKAETAKADNQDENVKIKATTLPSAMVYPNPVVSNDINIKFNNMEPGNYNLKLYNINGQLVASQSVKYSSTDAGVTMKVGNEFVVGKYEVKIDGNGKSINTSILKQ